MQENTHGELANIRLFWGVNPSDSDRVGLERNLGFCIFYDKCPRLSLPCWMLIHLYFCYVFHLIDCAEIIVWFQVACIQAVLPSTSHQILFGILRTDLGARFLLQEAALLSLIRTGFQDAPLQAWMCLLPMIHWCGP